MKRHEIGRRVSVPNPNGPRFGSYPHLAHVELSELDTLNAELGKRNKNLGCGTSGRCRRRTRFPADVGTCWYSGHRSVWGGNGVSGNLMCAGARQWECWCSVGYDGELAVRQVMALIDATLHDLDGFDHQFRELVRAAQGSGADLAQRWDRLRREEEALARREQNVRDAIKEYGPGPTVAASLAELVEVKQKLTAERRELEALAARKLVLPESPAALRELFRQHFCELAHDSREFNDLLRTLVPSFHVYLVRLVDGGHLLPRAKVRVALDGLAPDLRHVPGLSELLTIETTIDLFEPPQRAAIRERAVALAAQGMQQREIARELNVTQTAVGDALALDALMRQRGLTDPYVVLQEPPTDYGKLRRHKNRKYRFKRVDGYERPPLT